MTNHSSRVPSFPLLAALSIVHGPTQHDASLLEVIACSVADARAAAEGGATRLEVVRDLAAGGLTPPPELVAAIRQATVLPLRIMLRETPSFTLDREEDLGRMIDAGRRFLDLGAEGLVLGFLREGVLDEATLGRVLDALPDAAVTLHHAFDALSEPRRTLAGLERFPQIDWVLTRGRVADLEQSVASLRSFRRAAPPGVGILCGGGMDTTTIPVIRSATGLRSFHVGRAARSPEEPHGAVDAAKVAALLKLVRS